MTLRGEIIYYPSTYITIKEGFYHGTRLLHEMPQQERDERSQVDYNEERQAGDTGNLPHLWYQDVPDREELSSKIYIFKKVRPGPIYRLVRPFLSKANRSIRYEDRLQQTNCVFFKKQFHSVYSYRFLFNKIALSYFTT